MPADRGRYPPPAVAIPSPPTGSLVPGLPLPQARRPASDSMPATDSSPPDHRWLKPAGSPLTHARRSPLTLAPWIQSTSRPGVPCHVPRVMVLKSCLALRNSFNVSCRSCPWRLVQLPASLSWKRLLRDPVRAPDVMSCPEEASASKLSPGGLPVPVGCPVPVCLALEGCPVPVLFLSCPVCLAPEGSWYPLTSPGNFFWGVEGFQLEWPGRGTRPRPRRPPAMASWAPCTTMASRAPSSAMASRAPSSAMASVVCSTLEVPVLCSCPCLSWGASRAPTPPPRWNFYGVGHAFREGGVMSGFCFVCVMCSRLLCPYLVCFLSSSDVIIS